MYGVRPLGGHNIGASTAEVERRVFYATQPSGQFCEPGDDLCADCESIAAKWQQENPADAQCLAGADIDRMVAMCMEWKRGQRTAASVSSEVDAMIEARCPIEPQTPTAQPQDFAPPPAPSPTPQWAVEPPAPAAIDDAQPVYTQMPEPLQPTPDRGFRRWGPIVGVLLIVGGGIYLLR